MVGKYSYPFAAIVGQAQVKRGLLIAITNPKAGGLLIGGAKGTAKSTIVRGINEISRTKKRIDLPLNATEDMLFGTIDIEYAIQKGERRFSPGILARANENILYIDEINLLRSELLTAILDINTAGVNIVEREGIHFEHPARYTVIGTMNPEEGTLSPQILDRFGMYAEAVNEKEVSNRVVISKRLLEFERNIQLFQAQYQEDMKIITMQVIKAQEILGKIEVSEAMIYLAAQMCAQAFCAGHRAEIYLIEAAKAIAALDERIYILPKDMEEAAQFVLPHRMRKPPDESEQEKREEEEDHSEQEEKPEEENDDNDSQQQPQAPDEQEDDSSEDREKDKENEQDNQTEEKKDNDHLPPEEQVADIDKSFPLPKMMVDLGKDRNIRRSSGKRSMTRTDLKQGRYVRSSTPKGKIEDLAFDATIRAAAPFQRFRENNGCALTIKKEDLRQKVREKRIGNTFLFVVDASGSMGSRERMKAVKGAIFYMLQEAYQKRDRVGMIAFRRNSAEVLLPITRSVDLAQKCLREMPTGGKTPLAEGLSKALMTWAMMTKKDKEHEPILILITDGRTNFIDESGKDPVEQALEMAGKIGDAKITSVVIDTETEFIKLGVAKNLARKMGASYYSLKQLSEEQILHIVRNLDTLC